MGRLHEGRLVYSACDQTPSHKESKTTLKDVSLNRSSWGPNLTEVLCTCTSISNTTVRTIMLLLQ